MPPSPFATPLELAAARDADAIGESERDGFDVIAPFDGLFPAYHRWMEISHLTIGVRSPELKRLDEAIKRAERIALDVQYIDEDLPRHFQRGLPIDRAEDIRASMEKAAYAGVKKAFEGWAKSEGDWRKSRRESAATVIYVRLLDLQVKYPSLVPNSSELIDAGADFCGQLFRGAKVRLRGADLSNVGQIAGQVGSFNTVLGSLGPARQAFETMITGQFGVPLQQVAQNPAWAKELATVVPNLAHELVKLLPGVGMTMSTISAVSRVYDIYNTNQNRSHVVDVTQSMPDCDARIALNTIKTWQDQYIRAQTSAAVMDATSAGVQLATLLVPAGHPVSALYGTAKAVIQLMDVLVDLGGQYRESQALEKYLRDVDKIDLDIFAISPLVGAYYIFNVPFSVFSLNVVPFESPAFFAETEFLRESGAMKAVMADAERLLEASRFEIVHASGLQFRSREGMSTEAAIKRKAEEARRGLSSMGRDVVQFFA
jgi:hypothetical protein